MEPGWKKIIIIVFLIAISFTFGVRKESGSPEPNTIGLPYTKMYFNPILWMPYGFSRCGPEMFCYMNWTNPPTNVIDVIYDTPILLLGTLFYWYILSCIMLWIYYKVKKK